jgi:hypothetical protein
MKLKYGECRGRRGSTTTAGLFQKVLLEERAKGVESLLSPMTLDPELAAMERQEAELEQSLHQLPYLPTHLPSFQPQPPPL